MFYTFVNFNIPIYSFPFFVRSGSHRGQKVNNELVDRSEIVHELGALSSVDPNIPSGARNSISASSHGPIQSGQKRHARSDSHSFSFRGHSRQVWCSILAKLLRCVHGMGIISHLGLTILVKY